MDTSSRVYKILKRSQSVDDTDGDDSSCSESDCDLPPFMDSIHSGNNHIIY